MHPSSKRIPQSLIGLMWVVGIWMMSSCAATRMVPKGSYLLKKNQVEVQGNRIPKSDLVTFLRQKPNTEVFFFKFDLFLYNLAGKKTSRFSQWLRSAGEPPVVLDTFLARMSAKNMEQYLKYRGYYDAKVNEYARVSRRKATVYYKVHPGRPHRIKHLTLDIPDTSLLKIVEKGMPQSHIQIGDIFDSEKLKKERDRIVQLLREEGYYRFTKDYVVFQVDTAFNAKSAEVSIQVKDDIRILTNDLGEEVSEGIPHKKFFIKELVVYPNFDPLTAINDSLRDLKDTLTVSNMHLLYKGALNVKPKLIAFSNALKTDSLYRESDVYRTYSNYSGLRMFKGVSVNFEELKPDSTSPYRPLKGIVSLTPFLQQSYKIDAETSLSSKGLFGFGLSLGYQHKNIFGGAEILDISVSSAFQKLRLSAEMPIQNSVELGVATTLTFPSFLLPVTERTYRSVRNARTELGVSYTFQNRPDYRRNIINLNWGYAWSGDRGFSYSINPISLNVVNLTNRNSTFFDQITDPYLKSSYENHFNFGSYHSVLFSNRVSYKQSYYAIRGNLELNGNLLRMLSQAFLKPSEQNEAGRDVYKIFNIPYSQYAKLDIDASYLWRIDAKNALAFRCFAGLGVPYGNSYSLPIERMYYSGGPSSMRGWQIRSLGPGSYVPDSIGDVMYQVSDMKLEINAEYRFNLIKYLEGAVFMDVGNIWTVNKNDPRTGALFDWSRFYKEVAMNTGIGARLNLDFLVVRVDWGLQLKQPGTSLSRHWVQPREWIKGGASSWHFAIGYPF